MKKYIFIFFGFFSFLSCNFFSPVTFAQTTLTNQAQDSAGDIIKSSQITKCFSFVNKGNNVVELSSNDLPINHPVYIVACKLTSNNFICTTGNATNDNLLGITTDNSLNFSTSITNPIKSETGTAKFNVNINLSEGNNYVFYGIYLLNDQEISAAKSVQYEKIIFPDDPKNCASLVIPVKIDPYGRVFDAVSLEPIPNIGVSLLDNNKKLVNLPMVTNPQNTKEDGVFNFVVPAGTYYLNPNLLSNYSIASSNDIDSNYTKAYSNLLKSTNEQIIEKGTPVHKDIALKPLNGKPYTANPTKINYGVVRNGAKTLISGRVSHPLTIIHFIQNGKDIGITKANKWGGYSVVLDNSKIEADSQIEISFEKVDLTKKSTTTQSMNILNKIEKYFLPKEVLAQTLNKAVKGSSFFVDPIPSYIEGIAKDKNGKVLSNSMVRLKLTMSDKSYYETKTDENGKFTIDPKYIPVFNYKIEIVDSVTKKILVTNSIVDFAKSNNKYLAENKINLMTATKNNKPLISYVEAKSNNTQQKATNQNIQTNQKEINNSNSILFTLIVLFMIIVLIAITLFFMYKKDKI